MSSRGSITLAVGGVLFCLGVGILLGTGLSSLVPVDWLVDGLGHDYLVVALLALVALALALVILVVRSVEGFEQTAPPGTESVATGRPLATDIDSGAAGDLRLRDHLVGTKRSEIRDRLRRAAVQTVMRTEGCSHAAAAAAVDSGEWTDDERTATFLAADEPNTIRRLRDGLPGQSRFQQGVRATVSVICECDRGVSA